MRKTVIGVVGIYLLWLVSSALALYTLFWLRQFILIDVPMLILRVNPWVLRAVDRVGIVILGLGWLIFVIVSESYFRRALEESGTVQKIVKLFGIQALILVVSMGGHLLIG